jgi:hypothetical protein
MQLVSWSPFSLNAEGKVTYNADLGVLGTVASARANEFEKVTP